MFIPTDELGHWIAGIQHRGPDASHIVRLRTGSGNNNESGAEITLVGAVLHLRGDRIHPQPHSWPPAPANHLLPASEHGALQPSKNASGCCEPIPVRSTERSWLLWNGEVFGSTTLHFSDENESDTALLFKSLSENEGSAEGLAEFITSSRAILEGIAGPYGFIYWSSRFDVMLFARDPLGRRSLVFHISSDPSDPLAMELVVGSVATFPHSTGKYAIQPTSGSPGEDRKRGREVAASNGEDEGNAEEEASELYECWAEVPTTGLFILQPSTCPPKLEAVSGLVPAAVLGEQAAGLIDMSPWTFNHRKHPLFHGWRPPTYWLQPAPGQEGGKLSAMESALHRIADEALHVHLSKVGYAIREGTDSTGASAMQYLKALSRAVCRRVRLSSRAESATAPITVLFSGGVDSVVLAALTHIHSPPETPIELINVAFGDFPDQTPDRIACRNAFSELKNLPKGAERPWRLIYVNVPQAEVQAHKDHILRLVYPRLTVMDYNIGTAIWFAVRGKGVLIPPASVSPEWNNRLFRAAGASGAGSTAQSNVGTGDTDEAFKTLVEILVQEGLDNNGPDGGRLHLSALGKDYGSVIQPLLQSCGFAKLGPFVDAAEKAGRIKIEGGKTGKYVRLAREEDLSRARIVSDTRAKARDAGSGTPYARQGRVIILGMGADETLGGYVRHFRIFNREGLSGLQRELERDFERLWYRNLGRDDRIVSDHGVEGRFPFLDEEVLSVLSTLPPVDVCNPALPSGGDKLIIRTAARLLGLPVTSALQKRAIQFGTRIANRKVQGGTPLSQIDSSDALSNPRVRAAGQP
jgi:asparagine synthetase B (glutamine-hydrolysing)